MNTRFLARMGVGIATAVSLTGMTAVSAGAAGVATNPSPSPSANGQALTALKARCDSEVKRREVTLSADAAKINGATDLTAPDKAALQAIESRDAPGLTALDAIIQADTTLSQARTDCEKIVADYHVYVLFEPQIHLVTAADTVTSVDAKLVTLAADLQQKLSGNTNPAVQAALADLSKQAAAAQSAVNGISSSVLSLTPSGYPGNKTTLQAAQASLTSARGDLKQARTDIDTIREALKTATKPSPAA